MENRLKERLTGAAILVALIVLVVPELFHGQRGAAPGSARGSGGDPSVRSYVIELKDPAGPAAPPAVAAPSAIPADTVSAPAPAPAPAAAPAVASAPPAPLAHAAAGNSVGWSVQLGLFAQRENAQRLLQAAMSKGFAVSIAAADANGPYRVHVSGLADRAAAENLRARLRAQGFAAAVISP